MKPIYRLFAPLGIWLIVLSVSCVVARAADAPPPLLLFSMDAFRWDYCVKYPEQTPHLRQLMKDGISAQSLIPVYPSNTFPNHYSIATGLYPSHHGIINNHFFDPALGEFFNYNQPTARESHWWGGEPIWVTAIKQGKKAACSFWVGSEEEIEGVRPNWWRLYDAAVPFETRLEELFGWLHLPADQRPSLVAFYFEETNSAGHKFGPDSPELADAVKLLDSRIGVIVDRLKRENLSANVIVVSDHGMTPISTKRVLLLDDYIDLATVQVDFEDPVGGLRPVGGSDVPTLLRALSKMPHVTVSRVEDLPARFHITANPRNPPVWIVPEEGWEIQRKANFTRFVDKFNKGDHGFDPAFASMHAIFIAQGPSFKSTGAVIDAVENVHLYNLMCAALGLTPAPNDGDNRLVRAVMK